jgi:galactofuranose transport system substrate-binding protein
MIDRPLKTLRFIFSLLLVISVTACSQSAAPASTNAATITGLAHGKKTYKDLVVGFSQVGAESEWRTGNTDSIVDAAENLGVELEFSDGQQKQENQIKAIRTFIAERVDVIGVSPVVETGWESVLREAKEAGIPVILLDRKANVTPDLYATLMGSDFLEEGRNSAKVMVKLLGGKGKIVELTGTQDSAPAIDRAVGFREVLKDYPDIHIIVSRDGDFTRARGKEVMQDILKQYGGQIDALFAHNDDMAIGAIKAIQDYGLRPGKDIKIVSIDAVRDAFQAMIDGTLNATVECNPLLGPQFFELALKVANGEKVPKWIPSQEKIYYPDDAAQVILTRKY